MILKVREEDICDPV